MTSADRAPAPLARPDVLAALLVAVIAAAAFWPSLGSGFVSDDFLVLTNVRRAGGLRDVAAYFQLGFFNEFYRPVVFLSQAVDWTMWGLRPSGFHLTNILLHCTNTVLVFLLGRRLLDRWPAWLAALLFAVAPAHHETVYWIAARFDLMATGFALTAFLLVTRDRGVARVAGVAAYALALLSKESAVALPMAVAAYDALIGRRSWRDVIRRLLPLLAVTAGYAALRAAAAGLSPMGRASRGLKVLMMLAGLVAVVWIAATAHARGHGAWRPRGRPVIGLLLAAGVTLAILVAVPQTFAMVTAALGFVTFAIYYLISPVVVPPSTLLDPASPAIWMIGFILALVMLAVVLGSAGWLSRERRVLFLMLFAIAALIPVSSMQSGPRYLYLASVATSLLAGQLWDLAAPRWRSPLVVAWLAVLAMSAANLVAAAHVWRWSGDMTRDAINLIGPEMAPCGTRDVILITAPVGIGGAWNNLFQQALTATGHCAAKSFRTILRVEREDAVIQVSRSDHGRIDLVIHAYRDNLVGSRDLRDFSQSAAVYLRGEHRHAAYDITTAGVSYGRVEAVDEAGAEVVHWTPSAETAGAALFYYSGGRMHAVK